MIADVVIVLDEGVDLPFDRRAGSSSRVECDSSESDASVRSSPGFGDDKVPRAHAPCPYPQATWPNRRQRMTSHCLREAAAGALIAIMLGRSRLRCAYGVRRREALFQTFLKFIVRCFIRFRRFFRIRRVLIEWRWIEFVADRSLPV